MEVACPINLDPFSLKIFEVRILKIVSGEHFFQFLCTKENISQGEYDIVGGGKGQGGGRGEGGERGVVNVSNVQEATSPHSTPL